jgi:hypothetical protein
MPAASSELSEGLFRRGKWQSRNFGYPSSNLHSYLWHWFRPSREARFRWCVRLIRLFRPASLRVLYPGLLFRWNNCGRRLRRSYNRPIRLLCLHLRHYRGQSVEVIRFISTNPLLDVIWIVDPAGRWIAGLR